MVKPGNMWMVYCGFALLRFIKYVVRSFYHVVRRCQIFRQSWNLHKTGTPTFQTQKKLPLPDRHSRRFDMSELRNVPRIVVGLLKTRGCLQKMSAVCHRNPRLDR